MQRPTILSTYSTNEQMTIRPISHNNYWLPYFPMPWGSYCALPINQHLVQCASAHWDFANWWRVIANIPECRNWNCNKYSSSGPCGPSRICRCLFHRFPVRHTRLVLCFSLYKMTNWTVCLFMECRRREGKGLGLKSARELSMAVKNMQSLIWWEIAMGILINAVINYI